MHNHDHVSEKPNKYIVIVILAISLAGLVYVFSKPSGKDVASGIVREVLSEKEIIQEIGGKNKMLKEQELLVEIIAEKKRKDIIIVNDFIPVAVGDKIFISGSLFGDNEFSIVDISRTKELILLLIFFVVLVLLTSGWKGFYSLIGLLFSFAIIFAFIVPQIIKGSEPVSIGLGGSAMILIPTLYLSYGLNRKSIAAFLGIIFSLFFVGILANFVVNAIRFNGLSEVSMYLDMEASSSINLVGLLIAGIIIAAVGVLDDVAAIQSSVVFNLISVDPSLRGFKLFRKAMQVGRDHISAVVNTLILAYTGAALPLIILLYLRKMPVNYFVSLGTIAEEIIRMLISSSGLLLAVPLTTIIATIMVGKKRQLVTEISKLS